MCLTSPIFAVKENVSLSSKGPVGKCVGLTGPAALKNLAA